MHLIQSINLHARLPETLHLNPPLRGNNNNASIIFPSTKSKPICGGLGESLQHPYTSYTPTTIKSSSHRICYCLYLALTNKNFVVIITVARKIVFNETDQIGLG